MTGGDKCALQRTVWSFARAFLNIFHRPPQTIFKRLFVHSPTSKACKISYYSDRVVRETSDERDLPFRKVSSKLRSAAHYRGSQDRTAPFVILFYLSVIVYCSAIITTGLYRAVTALRRQCADMQAPLGVSLLSSLSMCVGDQIDHNRYMSVFLAVCGRKRPKRSWQAGQAG